MTSGSMSKASKENMINLAMRGDIGHSSSVVTGSSSIEEFVMSTNRSREFHSKMEDFLSKKDEKLKKLREIKAREEVLECNFTPQLFTRKQV